MWVLPIIDHSRSRSWGSGFELNAAARPLISCSGTWTLIESSIDPFLPSIPWGPPPHNGQPPHHTPRTTLNPDIFDHSAPPFKSNAAGADTRTWRLPGPTHPLGDAPRDPLPLRWRPQQQQQQSRRRRHHRQHRQPTEAGPAGRGGGGACGRRGRSRTVRPTRRRTRRRTAAATRSVGAVAGAAVAPRARAVAAAAGPPSSRWHWAALRRRHPRSWHAAGRRRSGK